MSNERIDFDLRLHDKFSKQFDKFNKQLDQLEQRLGKLGSNGGGLGKGLGGGKNAPGAGGGLMGMAGMARLAGPIGAIGAAAIGVGSKVVRMQAKISDLQANIRKTSGMSLSEVKALQGELQKLDTRTSLEELLNISTVGGQLGVAKSELRDFTQMVDRANVALGDEFSGGVEEITKELGGVQKLYKETKGLSAGDAINRIGSGLNALGAAGSATAPWMTDYAQRMGALGNMNMGLSSTMGYAAMFQESGLSSEIASSGMTNVLLKMSEHSDRFAKHLGMSRKAFEGMVNADPDLAFKKLAESLKNASPTQLAQRLDYLKIGTQESIKVLSTASQQLGTVTEKQRLYAEEMAKGTSLLDEFNIKNQTLGAELDKMTNSWENIFTTLGSQTDGWLNKMVQGITWLNNNAALAFKSTDQIKDEARQKGISDNVKNELEAINVMAKSLQSRNKNLTDDAARKRALEMTRNELVESINDRKTELADIKKWDNGSNEFADKYRRANNSLTMNESTLEAVDNELKKLAASAPTKTGDLPPVPVKLKEDKDVDKVASNSAKNIYINIADQTGIETLNVYVSDRKEVAPAIARDVERYLGEALDNTVNNVNQAY